MPRTNLLALTAAAFLLLSCVANTQLSSFTDPEFSSDAAYRSVVVLVAIGHLPERAELEAYAVHKLTDRGITAVRSIDIWPPTKQEGTLGDAVRASGAEALLAFYPIGEDVTNTYIPPTVIQPGSVTAYSHGSAYPSGGTWFQDGYTTYSVQPPVVAGGYSVSKPQGRYGAQVIDAWSQDIVWMSEGRSRGNAFARFGDLHRSMGDATIERLFEDGVLESS